MVSGKEVEDMRPTKKLQKVKPLGLGPKSGNPDMSSSEPFLQVWSQLTTANIGQHSEEVEVQTMDFVRIHWELEF